MRCPNCEKNIKSRIMDGKCPSCRTAIVKIGEEYVLDTVEAIKAVDYEILYNNGIVKYEKHKSENRHIMTFTRTMRDKWIRCPSCLSKDFMNMTVKGSLERKCHKCKAITVYIFE